MFSQGTKRMGFTLIEILLVVIILGILTAMLIPNVAGRSEDARRTAAKIDIESNLSAALDMYRMDNGKYPTSAQGLAALIKKSDVAPVPRSWQGPYLKKRKVLTDPWGKAYVYYSPGSHNVEDYDLASLGPDGVESEDDIVNWEKGEQDETQ